MGISVKRNNYENVNIKSTKLPSFKKEYWLKHQ